jgi:hypothetical protein
MLFGYVYLVRERLKSLIETRRSIPCQKENF